MADWSACWTRNTAGSSPTLTTTWNCFTVNLIQILGHVCKYNCQLVYLWSVGILNNVMFKLNNFFSCFLIPISLCALNTAKGKQRSLIFIIISYSWMGYLRMRGMAASWLVHYILERRSRFETLLGILRCNLGQDTGSLSTQVSKNGYWQI